MIAEIASLCLLVAVLVAAVVRPHGLPEVFVAVPSAAILVLTGVVDIEAVEAELDRLLPILVFLAAVLVLAHACAVEGLFEAAGRYLAKSSRGSSKRLLLHVFALSALVTSALSLDATALLLTPVVITTVRQLELRGSAHVYATGHLTNSASLLLPMGNLTNLLAIAASGLTLVSFVALMALPFAVVLLVEYVVLSLYFRRELGDSGDPEEATGPTPPTPRFAIGVLVVTLVGFVAASLVEIEPYWPAVAGAVVLCAHAVRRGLLKVSGIVRAVDVPFLLFVLGLAIVVRGVVDTGLGRTVQQLAPSDTGLTALLVFALIAVVLANVVNNLPALLILLAPAAAVGPLAVLAVLIGVNVGPNLTYVGSLATLLWRRVLAERDLAPSLGRFTVLGVLTVPVGVVLAVVALWAAAGALPADWSAAAP